MQIGDRVLLRVFPTNSLEPRWVTGVLLEAWNVTMGKWWIVLDHPVAGYTDSLCGRWESQLTLIPKACTKNQIEALINLLK